MGMPAIVSTSIFTPADVYGRDDLLNALSHRMSDALIHSVSQMGVNSLHSVIKDYCGYLNGQTSREITHSTAALATNAAREALRKSDTHPDELGLLICVTNSQDRPLPCMGYEVAAKLAINNSSILNLQNQGCSALLKAIEAASWYIEANPQKSVLIASAESHTCFVEPKIAPLYRHFTETHNDNESDETQRLVQVFLFGDAGFALTMKHSDHGIRCHSFHHLTNLAARDAELLTLNQGAAALPGYAGFPKYTMSREVPARGAEYAFACLSNMAECLQTSIKQLSSADNVYVHTGSRRILNGIYERLEIDNQASCARASYATLSQLGNVSSCSIGNMIHSFPPRVGSRSYAIAFGAGFSATSCAMDAY